MNKLRVLQFTMGMNPGGIAAHIRNLCIGLRDRGHEVFIAAGHFPSPEEAQTFHDNEVDGRVCVPIAVARMSPRYVLDVLHAANRLAQVLQDIRPDVIHLHSVTQLPVVKHAVRRASRRGLDRPIIVTTFNNEELRGIKLKAGRIAARLGPRTLGDALIAISSGLKTSLCGRLRIREDLLDVIDYAVDDRRFRPASAVERRTARQQFGIEESDFAIACVATICARKNQAALVQAAARLAQSQRLKLILAGPGHGSDVAKIRELATELGIEKSVVFLGLADARQVFWAADVNALVSEDEGFGLVVTEAAMCGLPSVRSRSAGADEQISDGENGWLIDHDDIVGISAALEKLTDPSTRKRMGKSAEEVARRRFTISRMAEQVESIYRRTACSVL